MNIEKNKIAKLCSLAIFEKAFAIFISSSPVGGLKSGAFFLTFSYKSRKLIVQSCVYPFKLF